MHGREDEVAGLGGLQCRLGAFGIAELADQDHVGVLAQRSTQGREVRLGVDPDLALVDDAVLVVVEDLDRVFDGDDVLPARLVDVVDDRGERRRLAGAGRAGDEHEPAVLVGHRLDARGHPQVLEARHVLGDDAERERDRAALAKGVDAETREIPARVGDVELSGLVEGFAPRGRQLRDDRERSFEVGLRERRVVGERRQLPVAAHDGELAHLQVDIARALFHGTPKDRIQLHALHIGTAAVGLEAVSPRDRV